MRVNEDDVRAALTWARDYGEIAGYAVIAPSGRRWRIHLPAPATVSGADVHDFLLGRDQVPVEMVLTSREALAFAYGCAAAGARRGRAEFAAREWGWGSDEESPDEPESAPAQIAASTREGSRHDA